MKRFYFWVIVTFILAALLPWTSSAQAPEKFTYQAVVRNASNSLVTNAQVGVRVNILQGSVSGTTVYTESHITSTNANGLLTVNIGNGSVLHGSFGEIDWSDGPYFLKTDIDPDGGNNYTISSTQQLMSVPYALYAKEAANIPQSVGELVNDANYITLNDIPDIPTVPTNVSAFTNDAGYITAAQVPAQVNADWNATSGVAQILNKPTLFSGNYNDLTNKPTIPTVPSNVSAFTNDAGYITAAQAPAQVNADWNATSGAAQILNKPTLFSGNYNDLTNKPTLFSGSYNDLTNKPNLSAVAYSGSYNDLTNKPSIPTVVGELTNNVGYITLSQVPAQVNADWNATSGAAQILNKPTLFSGNYNDLTNKPTIPTVPTNVSAFTNDAGYLTSYTETDPQFNAWDKDYNDLTNKPTIPTVPTNVSAFNNDAGYITTANVQEAANVPTNVSAFTNDAGYLTSYTETDPQFNAWDKDYNDLTNKPVLFSGNYNDLTNKPAIPTVPSNVSAFSNDAGYLTSYTETDPQFNAWDKDYNDLTNKPVLFSGNYNDLTNKPAIPAAANNATLTVQRNGSTVGTFTADASTNKTINISVPTTTNELTNNSGFITANDLPTVPANVSAFANDAGYLTGYTETQTLADVTAQGNSAGNRQLKNVSNPTENLDAVNLQTLTAQINALQNSFQHQLQQLQQQIDSLQDLVNNQGPYNPGPNIFVCGTSTVTDHEGNVYNTVQIGNQCWMRENLRTATSPTTGTYLIPAASNTWTYTGKLARWYNNDSATYAPMNYGLLYNWNAAMDTFNTAYGETSVNTNSNNAVSVSSTGYRRGICPAGWHLPSDAEWNTMEATVSGSDWQASYDTTHGWRGSHAGKLAGGDNWYSTSTSGTPGDYSNADRNASGFSAVPAASPGYWAYFWTSSQYESDNYEAYRRSLGCYYPDVRRDKYDKCNELSVRCLRNADGGSTSQQQPSVTTGTATNITSSSVILNGTVSNPDNVTITARGFQWKPTQSGSYTTVNVSGAAMSYNLTGLTANTSYTYRAFVTTASGTSYGAEVSFSTAAGQEIQEPQPCPGTPTVTDYDGNIYNTVLIDNQCWMKENLRTSHYTDGVSIALASGTSTSIPYRYYPGNNSSNVITYGYLYNWKAVTRNSPSSDTNPSGVQGICPTGWHVPSDAEWRQLKSYVSSQSGYRCNSGITYIAKALASNSGWGSCTESTCAVGNEQSTNNATGFTALPAGLGFSYGYGLGSYAYFWTCSEKNAYSASAWYLSYCDYTLKCDSLSQKEICYSVRCLKDGTTAFLPSVITTPVTDISANGATGGGNVTADGGPGVISRGVCWATTPPSHYRQQPHPRWHWNRKFQQQYDWSGRRHHVLCAGIRHQQLRNHVR